MSYYIVVENDENTIMNVRDVSDVAFEKEFEGKVVVKGDSLQDVFIKLNEKLIAEGETNPPLSLR